MSTANAVSFRRTLLACFVGFTVAGAAGCATTGSSGVQTVSNRASRFGAYPIDEVIAPNATPAHASTVGSRGYGYIGG
jgi:hypothetical protein